MGFGPSAVVRFRRRPLRTLDTCATMMVCTWEACTRQKGLNMNTLPTYDQLEALPSLVETQTLDLRVDTGDFRLWTARTTIDDGEPFDRTVYVETRDDERGWLDVGYYDGDDPVRSLPGVTPHAFRGEVTT